MSLILQALDAATPQDVETIDARIAELEEQLKAETAPIVEQIEKLKRARSFLQKALGLVVSAQAKAEVFSKATPAIKKSVSDYKEAIFDLLSKEGSMPLPAIAARLGIHPTMAGRCCNDPWFEKRGGQVHIAR